MRVLDRYILLRFLWHFFVLLLALYLFATAIDLLLNLDEFIGRARAQQDEDDGSLSLFIGVVANVIDFQWPRFFQFYAYMHGLVIAGAMAFTLGQMHRAKELVAIVAAGVSLHRIAMPIVAGAFGLSLLQLVNQEFVLPRVAPMLLRGHNDIGLQDFEGFRIPLTVDGDGNLLQATWFTSQGGTGQLEEITWLERDDRGRTTRRITAPAATWNEAASVWDLTDGRAIKQVFYEGDDAGGSTTSVSDVQVINTDITPHALTMRRHRQFAQLLSLGQINELLENSEVVDQRALVRYKFSRFSNVLVTMLVLGLCMPTFLLREPIALSRQASTGAGIAVVGLLGGTLGMMVDLPGISAAVGVFLPVLIIMLLALARWTYFKT